MLIFLVSMHFSWDEMAAKDVPAMISYVLKQTGQSEMFYIGHSQGTLVAMTEFSQNLQLANKVMLHTTPEYLL